MDKFSNICKKIIKEAQEDKKGEHVYVDNGKMSIHKAGGKKKIPLNIKNLKGFIDTLDTNSINVNEFHCQFEFTNGNSKLGKDTIIVNMGAATDCPSAKASLCELYAHGVCYANNQERGVTGKNIIPAKRRHGVQWAKNDATTIALSLAGIITKLRQKRDIKYVRMNEAGDFSTNEDIQKLKNVVIQTNQLLETPVIFYNYTHRSDLFPMGRSPLQGLENFILQGSGYRKDMSIKSKNFDTGKVIGGAQRMLRPAETKNGKKVAFMLDNCFYALQYSEFKAAKFGSSEQANEILPHGVTKEQVVQCPGDCTNCDQCKTLGNKFIVIVVHGMSAEAQTNVQVTKRVMTRRLKKNLKTSNNLPLEDDEIIKLYTSLGRSDYEFINKLYAYYKPQKGLSEKGIKDYSFTEDDIYSIWDRLEYLRSIAKNTKDAQAKDWIMPNTTGKSKLQEPLETYILKLQAKDNKKGSTLKESKNNKKQIDLMELNPTQLANLAVSGMLKKFPQFVSPKDIEDEMEDMEATAQPPIVGQSATQTTAAVVKESYRVQKMIEKVIKESK